MCHRCQHAFVHSLCIVLLSIFHAYMQYVNLCIFHEFYFILILYVVFFECSWTYSAVVNLVSILWYVY